MSRITPMVLGVLVAMTTTVGVAGKTDGADKYPNYYAARRALERRDCDAGVAHLEAYLRNHPDLQEKHRDHYRTVRFAIDQCRGHIKIRGVGDESGEIDPLPDDPPMVGNR